MIKNEKYTDRSKEYSLAFVFCSFLRNGLKCLFLVFYALLDAKSKVTGFIARSHSNFRAFKNMYTKTLPSSQKKSTSTSNGWNFKTKF